MKKENLLLRDNDINNIQPSTSRLSQNSMLLKELVNKIQGASLHLTFDYEIDKNRDFYAIYTDVEPDIDTMRMLLDNLMEVHVRLFASHERGRYKMYEINHRIISDYEFE